MDFLRNLDNNSILLIPNNLKNKILKYVDDNNLLLNIKLLTFNDIKKAKLDFGNEAIYYVMKNYHVKYDIALEYLNSLYYIEDNDHKKIQFLKELKNDLDNNNLLIYDELFIPLLKSKSKLYLYGFMYLDKFNLALLNYVKNYISCEEIKIDYKEYNHDVYKFNNMNDEICYVLENISKLINEGVNADKIHIANYHDEYYFNLKRFSLDYNIPVSLNNNANLLNTAMGNYFINNLSDNLDKLLYKVRKRFDINDSFNEVVYNKLFNLVNKFYWADSITSVKDILIEEMKRCILPKEHFNVEIDTIDIINNIINDDEYVFLIGFNNTYIPKIKKDTDYLNDSVKLNNKSTSIELNNLVKNATLTAIKSIKNLTITLTTSTPFNSYTESYLINDDALNLVNGVLHYSNYSDNTNKQLLARKIDNLIKFNEKDNDLSILSSNYDIPYKQYKNDFTGINNTILKNNIDNKMVFSYSNISKYYDCPFKFYISDILRVSDYEKTLDQFIGSLFHYVLEKCVDSDININDLYDEYVCSHINELDNTYKNKFFIKMLKDEIIFVVNELKNQKNKSLVNEVWTEKKIEIDVKRNINAKIKGFVDKVMFVNNSAIIVDYKTNSTDINKDLFAYGINIQLPIYLYLLKELDSNIDVAGFYIQHILDLNVKNDPSKDFNDVKKDKLKLTGITFNNVLNVAKFDNTFENSTVLKGVRIDNKNGGLKKNKHIMEDNEKEELTNLMESLIYKCIDAASDGDFKIHPIKIDKLHDGCNYCLYRDICYKKYNDYNIINIHLEGSDEDE